MNVVDSSGWLEYFADAPNADFFAPAIEEVKTLLVLVISIYEVFKRVLAQRQEDQALRAVTQMQQGRVIVVDTELAVNAAQLSLTLKLPMADSLILATARKYNATLWTQDADFKGLDGVQYVEKVIR